MLRGPKPHNSAINIGETIDSQGILGGQIPHSSMFFLPHLQCHVRVFLLTNKRKEVNIKMKNRGKARYQMLMICFANHLLKKR